MKQHILKLIFLSGFTFTLPVQAQRQESLLLGGIAGDFLGESVQLHALVNQTFFPLRINLLPLIFLDAKHPQPDEAKIFSALKQEQRYSWTQFALSSEEQSVVNNQSIMSLADNNKLDVIIHTQIKSLSDGYWLILGYFSGADGRVLLTKKHLLAQLTEEHIISEIKTDISNLSRSHITDVSQNAHNTGEIRLRTSPEHMLVYLNDTPVGYSPLILRYLPTGEHDLRLEEESQYQVKRLQVTTTPPGVIVKVNKKTIGTSPVELPAELKGAGEYQISFESKEAFQAEIKLQTTPENVPVQLNNSSIQRTPVNFQKLKDKSYQLRILPNPPVTIHKKINIDSPQSKVLEVSAYKYAKLILNTSVNNVRVEVDREYQGATPFSTKLSQGLHHIHLKKNRYRNEDLLLDLQAGENRDLFVPLKPRSADTSIFLTPTGELTPQLNVGTKYLGFGSIEQSQSSVLSHIYGIELDYGWPQIARFVDTFDIGLELSAFYFALHNQKNFTSFQGLGTKIQFLQENDQIPISAAIGSYINIDLQRPLAIGYLSLSRNFGDFALHMGLQTHGFNLNIGYTGWDDIRLGALIYADSFFRLLAKEGEKSTTFYGIQAGYSF